MGWETAVSSAANAFQVSNNLNTADAQAKALITSAGYQTQNIADNTVRQAGSVESSFLQGGISLQGGPSQLLAQIFAKGQTDITRTATNANNASSNLMNSARTNALSSIAQQFMRSSGGSSGLSSGLSNASNWAGQKIGGALDPSPVGPYQSPWG